MAGGNVLSAITFDVKGGSDTILPNHLLNRLATQGWPRHSIAWVSSFHTQRTASIRLDGLSDPQQLLAGSLPQGSPASPILFMLFMQPLFSCRIPGSLPRAGYTDDGKLSARSRSLEENCTKLADEFSSIVEWCTNSQIPLDHDKTYLMQFTRSSKASNPQVTLPAWCPTLQLEPVPKDSAMKVAWGPVRPPPDFPPAGLLCLYKSNKGCQWTLPPRRLQIGGPG
jgi:hypothetical protein